MRMMDTALTQTFAATIPRPISLEHSPNSSASFSIPHVFFVLTGDIAREGRLFRP